MQKAHGRITMTVKSLTSGLTELYICHSVMFPSLQTLVIVLLCFVVATNNGVASLLEVSPQNFTVQYDQGGLPLNSLSITCRPPRNQTTLKGVTYIQIIKYRNNAQSATPIATLNPNGGSGYVTKEPELAHRDCRLTGRIDEGSPGESFLRVELQGASCADGGQYQCQVQFYSHGGTQTEVDWDSSFVETKSLPEPVLLQQKPAYDSFVVNQSVQLHCTAQVGSPPAFFRWQYRRTGNNTHKETEFQSLTFGVLRSDGPFPQGFCKFFRTSTVSLRANLDLNGVQIRCLLNRGLHRYENGSASFTFKVKEAGCVPDCRSGGVCQGTDCQCPPRFTGSFCEHAVTALCSEQCDASSADHKHRLNTFPVCILLLLLLHLRTSVLHG